MSRHRRQKPAEWNGWALLVCTHCQAACAPGAACPCCDHYYGSHLPSGGDRERR